VSTQIRENLKISLAIKGARNILGMSLKELGAYCDVSPVTVGKWEANELPVKVVTFMKLNKLFNENGIYIDVEGDSVSVKMDSTGLDKKLKFHERRDEYKSGLVDDVQTSSDEFVVSPMIRRRRTRIKTEPE
jgi:transcriptional regulator with XRE-family HTH domain